jgi:secondary thiamine-phosphate synthase enzyme
MVAPSVAPPQNGFLSFRISRHSRHPRQFIDLTEEVQEAVDSSSFLSGFAVITSEHTTASIVVNEHEPELLKDLGTFLDGIAPESRDYAHNSVPCLPGERPNAHAHCQSLFLSASTTVPIVQGRLALGRYQRIFLVELDHARPRGVTVTLLGA